MMSLCVVILLGPASVIWQRNVPRGAHRNLTDPRSKTLDPPNLMMLMNTENPEPEGRGLEAKRPFFFFFFFKDLVVESRKSDFALVNQPSATNTYL